MSREISFGISLMLLASYGCLQYAGYCDANDGGTAEYDPQAYTYDTTSSSEVFYDTTISNDECIGTLY